MWAVLQSHNGKKKCIKIGTWNKKNHTRHAAVLERSLGELKYQILQLSHTSTGFSQTPSGRESTDGNVLLGLVWLSEAFPRTDASSSVCQGWHSPIYRPAMPRIDVYACQDLHILLFYWLWRFPLTKTLVVNCCCQRNGHVVCTQQTPAAKFQCMSCFVLRTLGSVAFLPRRLASALREALASCVSSKLQNKRSTGQICWNSNTSSEAYVPRLEPPVFQQQLCK